MDYKKLFDDVTAGNKEALPAFIDLKKYADDLAQYLEALKEKAVEEFNGSYGGREQVINGATVSKHSGGRYIYKDVPGWKAMKDKLTLMEKSAQLAYKAGGECIDEETGEVIVPAQYIPNKESITVKFLAADEPEFNEPPY